MPGMMDTVLNLGLNDEVAAGLAAKSGERFAYDSYRRFLDMFGNVVSICISHAPSSVLMTRELDRMLSYLLGLVGHSIYSLACMTSYLASYS